MYILTSLTRNCFDFKTMKQVLFWKSFTLLPPNESWMLINNQTRQMRRKNRPTLQRTKKQFDEVTAVRRNTENADSKQNWMRQDRDRETKMMWSGATRCNVGEEKPLWTMTDYLVTVTPFTFKLHMWNVNNLNEIWLNLDTNLRRRR